MITQRVGELAHPFKLFLHIDGINADDLAVITC